MEIARLVAGFNLQEADELRKSIGKKNVELMAKVKTKFLHGCEQQNKVSIAEAEEIFSWIEKSQRYSFNKSHSISYAVNGFLSAYAKAHFPRIFFASYLKFAKDKIDPQQEIKELVRNASEMDIEVRIPDLRLLNEFFILHNRSIYFGLTDIKGVGESVYKKMLNITKQHDLLHLNKIQTILKVLLNINSTAAKALIKSGALDYFKCNRTELLFEYDICSSLTDKELKNLGLIVDTHTSLSLKQSLEYLIQNTKITKKRLTSINDLIYSVIKPPYSMIDKIEWLSDCENDLLVAAISCSKLDTYDISMTNTNCKSFKNSGLSNNIIIAGEIANINIVKTKTGKTPGQEMAFVTIEDQTGILDSVIIFPETWIKYKPHLFIGNILIFVGNRGKSKDGLIVEKCFVPKS